MKNTMLKKICFTGLIANSYLAMAAGPVLDELGSLDASTAGAGSAALAETAVTAWSNPAGMTRLEGSNLTVNLAVLDTKLDYSNTGSTGLFANGDDGDAGQTAPVASFYYTTPLNEDWYLGFALASQGGSGIDYGKDFHAQMLLEKVEMATVQFAPSIAYKLNEQWSLGLSLNVEYLKIEADLDPLSALSTDFLEAEVDNVEVGYTLSAFYQPNENHRFGIIYRSELDHYGEGEGNQVNGDLKFDVGLDVVMPAQVEVSGVHTVAPALDFLWSVTWYDLSTWEDLTLDIGEDRSAFIADRNFDDVWNYAIGVHYQLNDQWRLETGISYETAPQDDPEFQYLDLPVDETYRYGLGARYKIDDNWDIRGYYEYIDLGTPEIAYTHPSLPNSAINGEYNNSAQYAGVQINYSF